MHILICVIHITPFSDSENLGSHRPQYIYLLDQPHPYVNNLPPAPPASPIPTTSSNLLALTPDTWPLCLDTAKALGLHFYFPFLCPFALPQLLTYGMNYSERK